MIFFARSMMVAGLASAILMSPAQAGTSQDEWQKLRTQGSYAIGLKIAEQVDGLGIDVEPQAFVQGILDALHHHPSRLAIEENEKFLLQYMDLRKKKMKERRLALAEKNKREGQRFLEENARKKGVVTMPSGLQYQVLKPGTGRKPTLKDRVKVRYRGLTLKGKEFASSAFFGDSAEFRMDKIIPAWQEALQLMPEGTKFKIFVPSSLAYGDEGLGTQVAPGETIIYEIELLQVLPGESDPQHPSQQAMGAK